jgi:hypothetical protein
MSEIHPLAHLRSIASHLANFRFHYSNESELQQGIFQALTTGSFTVQREARFSEKDRIDFLVDYTIALEVKIGSTANEVVRQLSRYAQHEGIHGILLITSRASHFCPGSLCGKPILLHRLVESAF